MKKGLTRGFTPKGSGFLKPKKKPNDKESGFSSSYGRLLGVLSEGPIEGPIGGLKGVYLNETVVENADGTRNFKDVKYDFRPGTTDQLPLPGFGDDVSSESPVGSGGEVKFNLPVTRTITNPNVDRITVRLGFQLQELPPTGGVKKLKLQFRIYIQEGLGPFVLRLDREVEARWSTGVELDYDFDVNNYGGTVSNFTVRVERVTPQDTDLNRYQRVMTWKVYGETIATRLSYPFSALAGMGFDASEFDSLPNAAFKLGGRLIAIPSNSVVATDRGLDYSGVWDGTFIQAPIATACPAWILYDLMVNQRYGLGKYLKAERLSKWSFYELSKYCNEFIQVGTSGYNGIYERRYQCNVLIENKEDATRVIDAFRSIFRGFAYWMDNALHIQADRPRTPSMIFTQADIQDGMFNYNRTPLRSRHTVARVTWIDPTNFYKQSIESVEDAIGIERYGIRELEMSAFGCISRNQAHRAGWAAILSERLEIETVRFRVRPYGAYAVPGMVIKVMDVEEAELRFAGLVVDADAGTVVFDHPVTIQSDVYTLTTMTPSGDMIEKAVGSRGEWGLINTMELTVPFQPHEIPLPESPWILSSLTIAPKLFQVLSVSRVSGENGLLYEISALHYDPNKYDAIDTDYYIPPEPPVPLPPSVVPPPYNLNGVLIQTAAGLLLSATWSRPLNANFVVGYLVEYQQIGGDWGDRQEVSITSASWDVLAPGNYAVRVASVDVLRNLSTWVTILLPRPNVCYDFSRPESSFTLGGLF